MTCIIKYFVAASILLMSTVPAMAGPLTIKVKKPGELFSKIDKIKKSATNSLIIEGTLNNDDIIALRNLCGCDTANKATKQFISEVDLGKVDFITSGAPYYFSTKNKKYSISSGHKLPACMFYEVPVTKVVFPSVMDSIGDFALSNTKLTEINIPKNVVVSYSSICYDSLLTEIELPDMIQGFNPYGTPSLKRIKYGNIDYMPSGSFKNMEELEEVTFDGLIGHIDGYMFNNCPRLKKITFNGPILSTGGMVFAENCPELQEINFNGFVLSLYLLQNPDCPLINPISAKGGVFMSGDSTIVAATPIKDITENPAMMEQIKQLTEWFIDGMNSSNHTVKSICISNAREFATDLNKLGLKAKADEINRLWLELRDPDDDKTKLQILKESAPYSYSGEVNYVFKYTSPDDSLLRRTREYFNLDSIAGDGDDISRIKNLLYWMHDLVKHDGSSSWPECKFNAVDLYEVCQKENRGLNCRFMAMMLAEALLAEGIPARYVTCMSKAYDSDGDCHVICVAWSESLGKWIWVDPTFAAFVTDENGLLLHPGEVRYRLQNDLPLILNKDANWNHKSEQTKESYLEKYMAKNLYIMECNLIQQSEPEGQTTHPKGDAFTLIPQGFKYTWSKNQTNNDKLFWAAPSK